MPSKCGCAPKLIDPNKLRHMITIQSLAETQDSYGNMVQVWSAFGTAWASIDPYSGYERMQSQQLVTPITHKIMMRYQAGITTKHRILFGARVFNILEALNLEERNIALKILASEGGGI